VIAHQGIAAADVIAHQGIAPPAPGKMELQCLTCNRLLQFSNEGWKRWKHLEINCEHLGMEHLGGGGGVILQGS
jgi:hypothetical protein